MKLTTEQARELLQGRISSAKRARTVDLFPIPGTGKPGKPAEDLRGRVVGDFVVVGFLCTGARATPWWVVRCQGCNVLEPRRGSVIRNRVPGRCPSCAERVRSGR